MDETDVFTEYTNSSFYSPDGLEATAPVFAKSRFPTLPSPLGQIVATVSLFERLPLADRASMVGLLVATVDCLAGDDAVKRAYDRMTAHELFAKFGLSERLVNDFLRPTLLVGLFRPPERLSALVTMELLYYYALAHQDSFDVRWIKKGTVATSLLAPLADYLLSDDPRRGTLQVKGGQRVTTVGVEIDDSTNSNSNNKVTSVSLSNDETIDNVDGVVLAVGAKGLRGILRSSPELAQRYPSLTQAATLGSTDVISVRLWFDGKITTRTSANVFANFEALRGAGGTFFMLDEWQAAEDLWPNDSEQQNKGSVVACDFYDASGLMALTDDELVRILTHELLPSAVPQFADVSVVDRWVGRYAESVTWFSPGSFVKRPLLSQGPNLVCAGDWVRMGEREHGAKGLCQERAYVSGMEAAYLLLHGPSKGNPKVLPVRDDEVAFRSAVTLNRQVMSVLPRFWAR